MMENKKRKNLQIILTVGLPCSGKSSWAKEQIKNNPGVFKRINKDLLREMLDNNIWSKENEKVIIRTRDALILQYLEEGYSVIIDDTNFGKHESHVRQLVGDKAEVLVQDFTHIPLEDCLRRDVERVNSVGRQVILRMYNQFLKDKPYVVEHDPNLPDCVISDLDGSMCLFGDKSPYERDFENDMVNEPLRSIVRNFLHGENQAKVIFFSGRNGKFKEVTYNWLLKNFSTNPDDFSLYMREEKDSRKDTVVKKEMYEAHVEGKYNVMAVFDDRPVVCRQWRQLGLPVFQVGNPDFEF